LSGVPAAGPDDAAVGYYSGLVGLGQQALVLRLLAGRR
jgi:hypothetical protein